MHEEKNEMPGINEEINSNFYISKAKHLQNCPIPLRKPAYIYYCFDINNFEILTLSVPF